MEDRGDRTVNQDWMGTRALGNRSILDDARNPEMGIRSSVPPKMPTGVL